MMSALQIRSAESADLPQIVALFEADEFNHSDRWNAQNQAAYEAAFKTLAASSDSALYVVVLEGKVVGTFMLTFMPVIYGVGGHRMILEGVDVDASLRSRGIGRQILEFSEAKARQRGARYLALTSGKKRNDAHRFYERNGYFHSHDGFRKTL